MADLKGPTTGLYLLGGLILLAGVVAPLLYYYLKNVKRGGVRLGWSSTSAKSF